MKIFFKISIIILLVSIAFIYLYINRTLPVKYGNLVLEGYYDGLVSTDHLKLFDNGRFKFDDGWIKQNGSYQIRNDTLYLDYYFPTNQPAIYVIKGEWLYTFENRNGKIKERGGELQIIENKLATTKNKRH